MEHKNIVATIYLKNGQAVKGMDNFEPMGWDVISLARLYNDSGIDKIIIFDLSDDDEEHEKNIHTIKNINRNVEIKVCAGGNISRFEDVKKFIYAGCLQVIVNGAKSNSMDIAREASDRFGKERILNRMCRIPQFMRGQMPPVPQSIAARIGIQPGTNCPGRFGTQ